ncbi:MAG: hypothetical protein K9J79_04030 [Desulfobacteraceae bacterium]|nr:hypothetical protein [Desulfobacteraceae bacterium]MCF8094509.1 hypothetical protein [Desulfobacteraceae bacterium]
MRNPSGGSNPARIIIVIVALVLLGVLGFFGWHRLMQWHEKEVQTAVEGERQKMAEQRSDNREDIFKWLEENVERKRPQGASKERLEDVFGKPVFKEETEECGRLERQIRSFFNYLETARGIGSKEKGAYEIFNEMIEDLAKTPPLVSGESRNLATLFRNRAHFFRVLGKDRIKLVLAVLRSDSDVLEHAMYNFYRYFISQECCREYFGSCIPEKTLYEYAAFFLDTLSGQSYLMRREAAIRTLTRYYSVLMLDRAIKQGINRHGIDLRPYIAELTNNIENRTDLRFKRRYLNKLDRLKEKYGEPSQQ